MGRPPRSARAAALAGRTRRSAWAAALAIPLLLALLACGSEGGGAEGEGRVTVSAAASLKRAFTAYGARFEDGSARFQFAGSDELVAQIRQGARPDVLAAANTELPGQLHAAGLVEQPVVFASNRLVLAVPAEATKVASLADLAEPDTTIAAGASGVPVGSYTRQVLARLPAVQERAILANVRSNEPDVAGVVGKLAQGAVDAGFVYVTDVAAAGGRLRAIELPERLQPRVGYAAAVVRDAPNPRGARAFVAGLRSGPGAAELRRAGFGPPPQR